MTEIHESTGSYALDALDAPEAAEFEAHLATCQTCSREVAMFSEIAAELSLLTQATPPAALRDRVLSAIRKTPQRPPDESVARPAAPPRPQIRPRTPRPNGRRHAMPGSEVPDEPEPPSADIASAGFPAVTIPAVQLRRR